MEQQDPPLDAPPRRLLRSRHDRVIGGVCGGLGEHTGIDPVVFRVVLAVAALAGGAGFAAYLVAWVCIPERNADGSEPPPRSGQPQIDNVAAVVLGVLGLILLVGFVGDGGRGPFDGDGGLLLLLLVGGGVWWWMRQESEAPPRQAQRPSYEPPDVGETSSLDALLPPLPTAAPEPPPRRSRLPLVGLSALLLLWGALTLVDLTLVDVDPQVAIGLSLAVVGAVLVVGAWYGRAHGLAVLGVLLAIVGGAATSIEAPPRGGFGERLWAATDSDELRGTYRLTGGEATLDLASLRLDRSRDVEVSLWAGELLVIVPRGVDLDVDGHVGIGELSILGRTDEGFDVSEDVTVDEGEGPVLRLDVRVGMGELEVRRAAA